METHKNDATLNNAQPITKKGLDNDLYSRLEEIARIVLRCELISVLCNLPDLRLSEEVYMPKMSDIYTNYVRAFIQSQGARIETARQERKMSVQDVAAAIGMSEKDYLSLEADLQFDYAPDTIFKLAELFAVPQSFIRQGAFFNAQETPVCESEPVAVVPKQKPRKTAAKQTENPKAKGSLKKEDKMLLIWSLVALVAIIVLMAFGIDIVQGAKDIVELILYMV